MVQPRLLRSQIRALLHPFFPLRRLRSQIRALLLHPIPLRRLRSLLLRALPWTHLPSLLLDPIPEGLLLIHRGPIQHHPLVLHPTSPATSPATSPMALERVAESLQVSMWITFRSQAVVLVHGKTKDKNRVSAMRGRPMANLETQTRGMV